MDTVDKENLVKQKSRQVDLQQQHTKKQRFSIELEKSEELTLSPLRLSRHNSELQPLPTYEISDHRLIGVNLKDPTEKPNQQLYQQQKEPNKVQSPKIHTSSKIMDSNQPQATESPLQSGDQDVVLTEEKDQDQAKSSGEDSFIEPTETSVKEEQKDSENLFSGFVELVNQKNLYSCTNLKDFSSLKVLGTGTYGKVMLVRHLRTQQLYAMKVLKKDKVRKKNQVERTKTERRVLERINHPFIVKLKYAFQDTRKLYFVLDYCCGGELFFYLTHLRRFREEAACFYASNILLALQCLHDENIIYRDLKPENVLIDSQGYALLTDFGLSKEDINEEKRANSLCGTPEYLAPELLKENRAYGKSCDWWSFGCVIYEMLTGQPPFYSTNRQEMYQHIMKNEPQFYNFHSEEAQDLLKKLLQKNPDERISNAEEIKKHKFFQGIDWPTLMKREIVKTPYKPEVKDPTDTSHFDKTQTGLPVLSPTKDQLSGGSALAAGDINPNADNLSSLYESDENDFEYFHFSPDRSPLPGFENSYQATSRVSVSQQLSSSYENPKQTKQMESSEHVYEF